MGPHTSSSSSSISWYSDLIQWIHNNGGYIHEDLLLQQEEQDQDAALSSNSNNSKIGSNHNIRGIWASQDIPKGTVLIRLPIQLAVSGKSFPSIYRTSSTTTIVGGVRGGEEVELERKASPWLRCVTALMSLYLNGQKSHHGNGKINDNKWKFYLNSLPNDYDTILVESSWPDQDIDMFLAGTTIGSIAQKDRLSNTLRERFDLSVKPYLIANKIIGVEDDNDNDDDLFALFQKACACVSTRGFHLGHSNNNDGRNNDNVERQHQKEDEEEQTDSSTDDYTGPFLLPFIDLLNHTSSPHVKCTTLQRNTMSRRSSNNTNTTTTSTDGSGYFSMMAERHVNKGEEILHSYGQNLTSGQLFQTFGFIEESLIRRAATISIQDVNGNSNSNCNCNSNSNSNSNSKMLFAQQELTPAILSKNDILEACQYIAFSKVPQELESKLTTTPEFCDCDDFDYWDLPSPQSLKKRNEEKVVQQSIPEDITISFHEPLSCDVVTCCCIQFLPDEVYDEMIMSCDDDDDDDDRGEDDVTKTLSMLSPEIILQDYFLGNLVLKTILYALERKALQYNHDMERFFFVNMMYPQHNDSCDSHNDHSILWNQLHRDQCLLNHLLHPQPQQDENEKKHDIHLMPDHKNQYQHAMYGLTLRIEEMTCLYQLELHCQQWLQSFPQQQEQQQQEQQQQEQQQRQHNEDEENDTFPRPCKQIKQTRFSL